MSDHEPAGWINRVPTMQSGPGIHQIRLYTATRSNSRCTVACVCGANLATINWGGDCWTPYRQHEQETTDDA